MEDIEFLEKLVKGLFNASAKQAKRHARTPSMEGVHIKTGVHGSKPIKLGEKRKTYSAYIVARRKRKALGEVNPNTLQSRATQTKFRCELCQIPLC